MRSLRFTLLVMLCVLGVLVATATSAFAAAPTVTSISPNNGPSAGGGNFQITGTGFIAGTTVKVGANAATGVIISSSTSISATAPAGSSLGYGTVDVTVTNANGTSAVVPADQYGYDAPPAEEWLGLNGNSSGAYLGAIGDFAAHGIIYDRGGGFHGNEGAGLDWGAGELPSSEDDLSRSIGAGMVPVITIENMNPSGLPRGATMINEYVSGFVTSAKAILSMYPGKPIVFEPINEPWFNAQSNGEFAQGPEQYAAIIAALLPECEKEGIPLSGIYVAAWGLEWVNQLYASKPSLKREIQGWYFHPYGPAHGTEYFNALGIESVPVVQKEMTSGQNNIIVSEMGYWTPDVNGGAAKGGPESSWAENSTQAASRLKEMLERALSYHQAGWLKALLVFSRNSGGWAMQLEHKVLTKQGEAIDAFADSLRGWSLQTFANPPESTSANVKDVSCTAANACTLVGFRNTGSGSRAPLAERWNGTSWSIQTTPSPSGSTTTALQGVSCSSSTACTAVGSATISSLEGMVAERWNGTSWSIQTTPSPSGAETSSLAVVSCPSTTSCMAVGTYVKGHSVVPMPLAESWNGTAWSAQTPPAPAGAARVWLNSISCSSSTACTAVGSYEASGSVKLLVERWNGTSWSLQTPANPAEINSGLFSGVSCTSATACTAVGDYAPKVSSSVTALVERWNGTSWSIQSAAMPAGSPLNQLSGVSCTSATSCNAVGSYWNQLLVNMPLGLHWDGTSWTIQIPKYPTWARESELSKISCVSSTACTSVGSWLSVGFVPAPLIEAHA